MKAEEFLKEKSDWFDKSPGGEKLYFESEVIRMMNEYAKEALRIHAASGQLPPNNCQKCGRSGYSMGTPFCTDEYCNGGNLR
jgi:hypothetical protein